MTSSPARPRPDETTPLLTADTESAHTVYGDDDLPPSPTEYGSLNKISRADLFWVLAGLWSAVFLGALDVLSELTPSRFALPGTIVATLLSPIGSYFNESNRASYIGTSYLLSPAAADVHS
ncbi:hypothetical protein EIP86_008722 [Pleurotus ostreatoroseus]|nr:hypothetical protein EIP86_008722 [Pleurotus ostreatoroseus]